MHRLFARQLAKATKPSGEVDLDALTALVAAAYEQSDRDRARTDRSISLMIEELDELNRNLERQVADRTAALREREAELEAQNRLFDATVNNMSQGLLMFDSEARMMLCNRRYLEMYHLSPDKVKPGCTLRELLEHRVEKGTFAGDPVEYAENLARMIAHGETYSRMSELPDGRTTLVISRPMTGGGWVVTHEDITERRKAEKQIAHMAHHDALTDLPNRVLFRERLSQALANLGANRHLAVLYLDLDQFKGINDTHGHQFGDELLIAVADRLVTCLQDDDTVARVGGDEFAIIRPSMNRPEDAGLIAHKICDAIRAPYNLLGHSVLADTSIGIALAPTDGNDPDTLLKNADMALYSAKADGRGTYHFFEPEMDARNKARRALENELRLALANGQFTLHYQPILSLTDGGIPCCEALIRWQHPERGLIGPAEFIPLAEEIGLIVQIGEWVLRTACADAAKWPNDVRVAVNLSPIQVMNPNLVPMVVSTLAFSGLPAHRLELEITETVMMHNTQATLGTLHRLRELGVKIAMDDFGTGFSSLRYLRSFPFDKLKIDRCFISDLSEGDDALAIVRAVTTMAASLGMVTTAEGVETSKQLDKVRSLGCTEVQGFFISHPKPVAQVVRMISSYLPKQAKSA